MRLEERFLTAPIIRRGAPFNGIFTTLIVGTTATGTGPLLAPDVIDAYWTAGSSGNNGNGATWSTIAAIGHTLSDTGSTSTNPLIPGATAITINADHVHNETAHYQRPPGLPMPGGNQVNVGQNSTAGNVGGALTPLTWTITDPVYAGTTTPQGFDNPTGLLTITYFPASSDLRTNSFATLNFVSPDIVVTSGVPNVGDLTAVYNTPSGPVTETLTNFRVDGGSHTFNFMSAAPPAVYPIWYNSILQTDIIGQLADGETVQNDVQFAWEFQLHFSPDGTGGI
jgi:hypothetical protein